MRCAGMRAMGFRGGNAAPPHQQAVLPLLDRVSDIATLIGAVNLITREDDSLLGDNTEGKALLGALRPLVDPAGKRVLLLGTGNDRPRRNLRAGGRRHRRAARDGPGPKRPNNWRDWWPKSSPSPPRRCPSAAI